MAKFVILRDQNANLRARRGGGDLFESLPRATESVGSRGAVPPSPAIETEELTQKEVNDAVRDPNVVEIARAMPTKLIMPVEMEDTPAAVPTWGVERVGATTSPFTGVGVKAAVLDTGIDPNHPAFNGVTLTRENFSDDGPDDGDGHGTHCAGTIFGRDVDGTRIGVAPGITEALIGKVLGDDGSGSSDMLFNGMQWAEQNGARVISMSLGFDFPGLSERLIADGFPPLLATSVALEAYRMNLRVFDRIMAMFRAKADFTGGVIVVAASGNESRRQIDPNFEVSASVPAAAEGIVSVGAVGESPGGLTMAPFSNTNPTLSAPGVGVVSAQLGGGLTPLNGTSMACPHVAGCAALWWESTLNAPIPATQRAVEARLLTSAITDPFAAGVDIADRGDGLVQAPSGTV
ncbi:MAG: S8 family serine peptidase [Pseudomonadota bacterium]